MYWITLETQSLTPKLYHALEIHVQTIAQLPA